MIEWGELRSIDHPRRIDTVGCEICSPPRGQTVEYLAMLLREHGYVRVMKGTPRQHYTCWLLEAIHCVQLDDLKLHYGSNIVKKLKAGGKPLGAAGLALH